MDELRPTATGFTQGRISIVGFQVIIWLSSALSLPFVPFRLFVRIKIFKKLFVDDYLVVLAWCLLLAYSASLQRYAVAIYTQSDVSSGRVAPGPDFIDHFGQFLTASVLNVTLQVFCLWSIKFAFLLFFRRLGRNVRYQVVVWWAVVAWNIIAFAVWYGIVTWHCIVPPTEVVLATCNTVEVANFSQMSLKLQTAMDVLSDASSKPHHKPQNRCRNADSLAVIVIPVSLLWNVQIKLRKKLALAGIFSLTVFIMIASIIRVVVTTSDNMQNDQTWLFSWAAIEMAVAVIVACLASYRALFTGNTISQRLPAYNAARHNDPERRALAKYGFRSMGRSSTSLSGRRQDRTEPFDLSLSKTDTFINARDGESRSENLDENDIPLSTMNAGTRHQLLPPGAVHVRRDFVVHSQA